MFKNILVYQPFWIFFLSGVSRTLKMCSFLIRKRFSITILEFPIWTILHYFASLWKPAFNFCTKLSHVVCLDSCINGYLKCWRKEYQVLVLHGWLLGQTNFRNFKWLNNLNDWYKYHDYIKEAHKTTVP